MTTMTVSNWVTQVADERRGSLDLLAKIVYWFSVNWNFGPRRLLARNRILQRIL